LIKLVDFGLVKVLVKDDSRTITVLQGRGTAAYTPLEQYGEDDTHTDARSDIYSFGATLYHLLTNQSPPEAKQRFLKPETLIPPRAINPAISEHVERAIVTAISMHPDDRPTTVAEFGELLFSDHSNDGSARPPQGFQRESALDLVRDNVLWIILAGATAVVGFLATVLR
jgi:serine/threonine protein kinase